MQSDEILHNIFCPKAEKPLNGNDLDSKKNLENYLETFKQSH